MPRRTWRQWRHLQFTCNISNFLFFLFSSRFLRLKQLASAPRNKTLHLWWRQNKNVTSLCKIHRHKLTSFIYLFFFYVLCVIKCDIYTFPFLSLLMLIPGGRGTLLVWFSFCLFVCYIKLVHLWELHTVSLPVWPSKHLAQNFVHFRAEKWPVSHHSSRHLVSEDEK